MSTTERTYTIDPLPADQGPGWRLKMMEGETEMGGGVFPPKDESSEALRDAHWQAEDVGDEWVSP